MADTKESTSRNAGNAVEVVQRHCVSGYWERSHTGDFEHRARDVHLEKLHHMALDPGSVPAPGAVLGMTWPANGSVSRAHSPFILWPNLHLSRLEIH